MHRQKVPPPKFTTKELVNFGLAIPMSKLTLAFQTLIWHETSPVDPVRPGGGILLFGPPNCGGDHLVDTVLGQAEDVQKIHLEWETLHLHPRPNYVKTTFQGARDSKRAVIIMDNFNELVLNQHIREEIMTEIHLVVTSGANVFVVAHATAPWNIGHACLDLFQYKIHIPGPNQGARAALLDLFLGELRIEKKLEKVHSVSNAELKSIVELPSLTKATWEEIKKCAHDSFQHACRAHLGLSSDQSLSMMKINPAQLRELESVLVITSEHVRIAGMQMKIKNSSSCEIQDLKLFKKKWNIIEHSPVKKDKVEDNHYPKDKRKKKLPLLERFLRFLGESLEPWI